MEVIKQRLSGWVGPLLSAVFAIGGAAIVGLIIQYGEIKKNDAEFRALCVSVSEIKSAVADLGRTLSNSLLTDTQQTSDIINIKERFNEHILRNHKYSSYESGNKQ